MFYRIALTLALLDLASFAGAALAQPADCQQIGDGPPMTLGLEVGLGNLPSPRGNNGGAAWVEMHDVPSYGSHCQASPLPPGDPLHGPPGDVLHGLPSPQGLLVGPIGGTVTVGPSRPVGQR